MVKITNYLSKAVLAPFSKMLDAYYARGEKLCILKTFDFSNDNVPDYTDKLFQLRYLLNYASGYAYEYEHMYTTLLERGLLHSQAWVNVTSIGCGAMIDYWGIARALERTGRGNVCINYVGLDLIDWENKIYKRPQDERPELPACDAIQAIKDGKVQGIDIKVQDTDIFVFPKSISELDHPGIFDELCVGFRGISFTKDRIHFLISIRPENKWKDIPKVKMLIEVMQEKGYVPVDHCDDCEVITFEETKLIGDLDEDCKIPDEVWERIPKIYSKCVGCPSECTDCPPRHAIMNTSRGAHVKCEKCMPASSRPRCADDADGKCHDTLTRLPIKTTSQVSYIALTFDRKA